MALNFPSNPAVGDIYRAEGAAFQWTGTVWVSLGPGPSLGVPVGTVSFFAGNVVPDGWLLCNNQVVTALYPDLRDYLRAAGSPFGSQGADPRVPELRGEFVRGFDGGRGVDVGRVFGSAQGDEFKSHFHTFGNGGITGGGFANLSNGKGNDTATASVGGTETRPRNIALLPCIKAFDAVDITGMADLSQLLTAIATPAEARAGVSNEKLMTPAAVQARQGVQALTMAGKTNVVFDQVPLETSEMLLTFAGINLPANSFLTFDWFDQPLARAFSGRSYTVNGAVSSVGGEDNHGNFALENNTVAGFPTGVVRLVWDEQGSWIVTGTLRRSISVQASYSGSYNGAGSVKPRQLRLTSALAVLSGTPGNVSLRWRI